MKWLRGIGLALGVTAAIGIAVAWGSSRDSRFGWIITSYSAADGTLTTRYVSVNTGRFIVSKGTHSPLAAIVPPRQISWYRMQSTSSDKWPLWGRRTYGTAALGRSVLGFEARGMGSAWFVAVPCWAVLTVAIALTVWPIRRRLMKFRGRGFELATGSETGANAVSQRRYAVVNKGTRRE